jgi:hypothetical protein
MVVFSTVSLNEPRMLHISNTAHPLEVLPVPQSKWHCAVRCYGERLEQIEACPNGWTVWRGTDQEYKNQRSLMRNDVVDRGHKVRKTKDLQMYGGTLSVCVCVCVWSCLIWIKMGTGFSPPPTAEIGFLRCWNSEIQVARELKYKHAQNCTLDSKLVSLWIPSLEE